jgi:hypothetical protein
MSRADELDAVLTELLRLYDWRNKVGKDITREEALRYGAAKKAAWEAARRWLSTPKD